MVFGLTYVDGTGNGRGIHARAGGEAPQRGNSAGVFRGSGLLLHRDGPLPRGGVIPPISGQGGILAVHYRKISK